MTTDYKREYESTHVMITVPEELAKLLREGQPMPFRDGGMYPIVLDTGNRVWVGASYWDDAHDEIADIKVVNDGSTDSRDVHDHQGNMVLSVPAAWCKFYTPEEVEAYEQMRHADEQLLGYAN